MTHLAVLLFVMLVGDQPQASSRDAILSASRTIIANARYATLVTLGDGGAPSARIVDPFAPEGEMTVWLATNSASQKVADVRKDARVSLLYFDAPNKGYVEISGRATLVTSAEEKAARWKPEWAGMYKDKNNGSDYLLIRVVPEQLEIVSVLLGMNNDPVTWRPVTLVFAR